MPPEQQITGNKPWQHPVFLFLAGSFTLIFVLLIFHEIRNSFREETTISEPFIPSSLPDNLRYDKILWICAHNAMNNTEDGWLLPNQTSSIPRLLKNGIHAQMWDVWMNGEQVVLRHGPPETAPFGSRPLSDALNDVIRYLKEDKRAVVTILFEAYVTADELKRVFDITDANEYCYTHKKGTPWPTLGALRKSGKRMIVFTDKPNPLIPWLMPIGEHCVGTPWNIASPSQFSSRFNRGKPGNALFVVNHFITNPIALASEAEKVNALPFLEKRIHTVEKEAKRKPQFLALDFVDSGDAYLFIKKKYASTPPVDNK